jgi:hypothetical protein
MRGDSAANWTSANPVLAEREMGLETDTNKFKVGDGSLAWTALSYYNYADTVTLTGGTGISITNDYEISFTGGTIPTTYPYDLTVAASDETTAITTGTAKLTFISPAAFTLTGVTASLTTTGSTSSVIDVNYNGSTVFASPITLASGEYYGTTATTTSAIARYGKFTIDIDTAGTDATGVKISLEGNRNL